jgi:putative NADH-flavin reductase
MNQIIRKKKMKNESNTPVFKIAVLGANGGIGQQVVKAALNYGHNVTAILRTPSRLTFTHPNLIIVKGDIMKPETLEEHLRNKDGIISAIGKNSLKKTTLYSEGNRNLLNVMKRINTNRVFFISASGLEVNPSLNIFTKFAEKFILQKILKNMFSDLKRMERIVKESDQNWTIIRPPSLTNKPVTGHYRYSVNSFLKKGLRISRADLAHFIIRNIANESIYKKTVEVAY